MSIWRELKKIDDEGSSNKQEETEKQLQIKLCILHQNDHVKSLISTEKLYSYVIAIETSCTGNFNLQ